MSFLSNKKSIAAGLGVLGIAGTVAFAATYKDNEPTRDDNNSCGAVNLVSVDTYKQSSSATYHYVDCENDNLGKTTVSDGTFTVDAESVEADHVVAALGAEEAARIGTVLETLNDHLASAPADDTYYIHNMPCESSVSLKGVDDVGGIKMVTLEIREEFRSAMPLAWGCQVSTESILPFGTFSDARFTQETIEQVRDLQRLIAQPMSFNP